MGTSPAYERCWCAPKEELCLLLNLDDQWPVKVKVKIVGHNVKALQFGFTPLVLLSKPLPPAIGQILRLCAAQAYMGGVGAAADGAASSLAAGLKLTEADRARISRRRRLPRVLAEPRIPLTERERRETDMNALCKTCPSARPYQGEDGLGCPLKGSRDGKNALCKKPRKTHASDAAPPVPERSLHSRACLLRTQQGGDPARPGAVRQRRQRFKTPHQTVSYLVENAQHASRPKSDVPRCGRESLFLGACEVAFPHNASSSRCDWCGRNSESIMVEASK